MYNPSLSVTTKKPNNNSGRRQESLIYFSIQHDNRNLLIIAIVLLEVIKHAMATDSQHEPIPDFVKHDGT